MQYVQQIEIEFMQENLAMQRAWKFLKDIKDSIPGI